MKWTSETPAAVRSRPYVPNAAPSEGCDKCPESGGRPKSSTHSTRSSRKRLAEAPHALRAPRAESIDLRHRLSLARSELV